jgi:sugar lactone lactonase YvrE
MSVVFTGARRERQTDGTGLVLLMALVIAGGSGLPGCRKSAPIPPYESFMPKDADKTPKTELTCEPAGTMEPNVGTLRGIATDAEDRVYAVGSSGLRVFDATGCELKSWKVPEDAQAVAVAEDGAVYVAVTAGILKFDREGKALGGWGREGARPGELRRVTSVAALGSNVFVADARNLCIHRFDADGVFLNEIGKRSRETGFLGIIAPSPYLDFVVDKDGQVIVGNPGRLRVETYTTDGKLLGFWGEPGLQPERFCGCCNPTNLALTRGGLVVTSEKGIPRVKVYDRSGRMLAYIPPKTFPAAAAGMDLAVDSRDRIYVAEPVTGRILVFEMKKSPE